MRAAGAAVICAVIATSCVPAMTPAADNAVDLRYRLAARGAELDPREVTATAIYGWVSERSLATPSRCKMVPTDAQAFSARAQRCGGGAVAAWYQGIARLFLEQAGSARFARSIQLDGRLRWMDVPAPCAR